MKGGMQDPVEHATDKDILLVEIFNESRIYLYFREGEWRAYEHSAYLLCGFYPELEAFKGAFRLIRPGMATVIVAEGIREELVGRFRQKLLPYTDCIVLKTATDGTPHQHWPFMAWRETLTVELCR